MIICGGRGRPHHKWAKKVVCLICGTWQQGKFLRTIENFWKKIRKGDGCWEWTGHLDLDGYGKYGPNGYSLKAHRVMWMVQGNGTILPGQVVCHRCDNPKCVRPDHLFLGTAKDNQHDMIRKGRKPYKIHPRVVAMIQSRRKAGESIHSLAQDYGVSETTIFRVATGRRKDVTILSRDIS